MLELCDQKLLEFVCNVDNKDMVWLEEIEEEAERMFTRCEAGGAGGGRRQEGGTLAGRTRGCLAAAAFRHFPTCQARQAAGVPPECPRCSG